MPNGFVISRAGNYVSKTTSRIVGTSLSARDQVAVPMEGDLSGGSSGVDPDIETSN